MGIYIINTLQATPDLDFESFSRWRCSSIYHITGDVTSNSWLPRFRDAYRNRILVHIRGNTREEGHIRANQSCRHRQVNLRHEFEHAQQQPTTAGKLPCTPPPALSASFAPFTDAFLMKPRLGSCAPAQGPLRECVSSAKPRMPARRRHNPDTVFNTGLMLSPNLCVVLPCLRFPRPRS